MSEFVAKLEKSTAHRQSRESILHDVLENRELLSVLMSVLLDVKNKNHHKACWVSELVFEENIDWLSPYLEIFCDTLSSYSHDGAIRSVSKICMFSASHHIKKLKKEDFFLTEKQMEIMVEACFDWLITDKKVASKAYAMRALFEFGKIKDWIYPELKIILQQNYPYHSAGYQAASKDLLKRMKF